MFYIEPTLISKCVLTSPYDHIVDGYIALALCCIGNVVIELWNVPAKISLVSDLSL